MADSEFVYYDNKRRQMLLDAHEWKPLRPISALMSDIEALVPKVKDKLFLNKEISRKKYNGIRPERIEQDGEDVAAWELRVNATDGLVTHVYLTEYGGLRSYPHYVSFKRHWFARYRRETISIPFSEYVETFHEDSESQRLLQIELNGLLNVLRQIIPSVEQYHLADHDMGVIEVTSNQRTDDAKDAESTLKAQRDARAARRRANGGGGNP